MLRDADIKSDGLGSEWRHRRVASEDQSYPAGSAGSPGAELSGPRVRRVLPASGGWAPLGHTMGSLQGPIGGWAPQPHLRQGVEVGLGGRG